MSDFNLWHDPWIRALRPDGAHVELSISALLSQAHEVRSFYDPSPLTVVGIHRLLSAILQSIYDPQSLDDIAELLEQGRFEQFRLDAFGTQYGARFSLFDATHPFMQTSDVSASPGKEAKTVAYLLAELPSGSNRIHFQHVTDDNHRLCPACCARAMLTIPAFASSGGQGIKPSINGVPPTYLLPIADTLAHSLILSLMVPGFQPKIASKERQHIAPWNTPQTIIPKIAETLAVGYIESLTFLARRIRLYPEQESASCTHCGAQTDQYVKNVLYEMGWCRPKGAELWKDPFAAFRATAKGGVVGVRPVEGKALWREYATLFLSEDTGQSNEQDWRPSVLLQMYALIQNDVGALSRNQLIRFRAIGLRTDQAKMLEWFDDGLDVPTSLLCEVVGRIKVQEALQRAEILGQKMSSIVALAFRPHAKREWFKTLRERMIASYWTALALPFRAMIQQSAEGADWNAIGRAWANDLLDTAGDVARESLRQVGGDADLLRRQVQAEDKINALLGKRRKEWMSD